VISPLAARCLPGDQVEVAGDHASPVKTSRGIMEILEAYDLRGSRVASIPMKATG